MGLFYGIQILYWELKFALYVFYNKFIRSLITIVKDNTTKKKNRKKKIKSARK